MRFEQDLIDNKVIEVDDIGVNKTNEVGEISKFYICDCDVFDVEELSDQVELQKRVRTLVLL